MQSVSEMSGRYRCPSDDFLVTMLCGVRSLSFIVPPYLSSFLLVFILMHSWFLDSAPRLVSKSSPRGSIR
jgi:hypothetical protein